MQFNNLFKQQELIKDDIDKSISRVLSHGKYIMGPEVKELEATLSKFTGSKFCITTSSGTDALLISLMAIGIKNGDEVITTPFTFVSTVEVIVSLGAIPIFVDIEEDTCNINAELIEEKITKKTKAIIAVSLFGQTSDMKKINRIAEAHANIAVIEDAAQSFGATYDDKRSCNLSKIGCTSFFPAKPLGCYGDGGAIFTNDEVIDNISRSIRIHGQKKTYEYERLGLGGRMDTLQCAILLAKFKIFENEIILRKKISKRYDDIMDSLGIRRLTLRNNRTSVSAQYCIFTNERQKIIQTLNNAGIPTAIYYPKPLNEQEAYKKFNYEFMPIASKTSKIILSLPMSAYLTDEEQNIIFDTLKKNIN
jgi:UDP-2-acetamido-2-deoxy-ribo-hexuluronate aminotransferase